jgi:hypothetical protein
MLQQAFRIMQPFIRRNPHMVGSLQLPNVDRMILMQDYLHTYRIGSCAEPALSCRVRVYQPHPHQPQPMIVLYSAMGIGSITTWAEDVATPIWQRLQRPRQVYFVEHWQVNRWNMSEFMLVQFEAQRGRLINPRWAELRRGEIEAIVHGPIESLTR